MEKLIRSLLALAVQYGLAPRERKGMLQAATPNRTPQVDFPCILALHQRGCPRNGHWRHLRPLLRQYLQCNSAALESPLAYRGALAAVIGVRMMRTLFS